MWSFQGFEHFLVTQFPKIFIPQSHTIQILRLCCRNEFVCLSSKSTGYIDSDYRRANHNVSCAELSNSANRRYYAGAGCNAIINEQNRPAVKVKLSSSGSIKLFPSLQFQVFPVNDRINRALRNAESACQTVVDQRCAPTGDSSHG